MRDEVPVPFHVVKVLVNNLDGCRNNIGGIPKHLAQPVERSLCGADLGDALRVDAVVSVDALDDCVFHDVVSSLSGEPKQFRHDGRLHTVCSDRERRSA